MWNILWYHQTSSNDFKSSSFYNKLLCCLSQVKPFCLPIIYLAYMIRWYYFKYILCLYIDLPVEQGFIWKIMQKGFIWKNWRRRFHVIEKDIIWSNLLKKVLSDGNFIKKTIISWNLTSYHINVQTTGNADTFLKLLA